MKKYKDWDLLECLPKDWKIDKTVGSPVCIHELEATANNYYTPKGKELKGWNLLLGSRDKLVKMRDKDWEEWERLK